MIIKKILSFALGGVLMIGDCCASGQDIVDQDHKWLHQWKSIEDVNQYSYFLSKFGPDHKGVDYNTIEEIIKKFKQNDELSELSKLCILTNALYSVAIYIQFFTDIISTFIKSIVTSTECKFNDQSLDNQGFYTVKWAWLLFLSQTVDGKGEELIKNFEVYPICTAKEFLEEQKNQLCSTAKAMLEKINTVWKE